MNLLAKIFTKKRENNNFTPVLSSLTANDLEDKLKNDPPEDLFIDNEPPKQERNVEEMKSKISEILERNFYSLGIKDGHEFHSQEIIEIGKKRIRAEFQLAIDQSIQDKNEKKLQIKNLIVDISNISNESKLKLENTLDVLESSLNNLQVQKELSIEDEGWVMNIIHTYHQGFMQGINDFIAEQNLFNQVKNI